MQEMIKWLCIIAVLVGAPLGSVIWLYLSWNRYKETVPFTEENKKQKLRLTVAAVIAAVMVGFYLIVMGIYGVTVFFAN